MNIRTIQTCKVATKAYGKICVLSYNIFVLLMVDMFPFIPPQKQKRLRRGVF